jgi:arginyl-tRNA synthetase
VQLYQFVKIVEGGRAVSASKRRGTVLMLDELLDAIGVDAAATRSCSALTTS